MGGSSSKSESESDAGFSQSVWQPQGDALRKLYSQIGSLFSGTMGGMQNRIPVASNQMQQVYNQSTPYWNQQLQGGAYRNMDLQNQLMSSLNRSMGQPSATQEINNMIMGGSGNNYADAMKAQYMQDADRAQQMMLSNMDARAAMAGQGGSSRHGVAQALGMQDINRNLQSNLAQTGYETFDKDLQRKLAIAGQADQATLARQQMMQDMLGQQQQAMQSGLGFGSQMQQYGLGQFAPYMMPWQAAGMYGNIIGRPTILGAGSMSGDSESKGMSGGIGGGK